MSQCRSPQQPCRVWGNVGVRARVWVRVRVRVGLRVRVAVGVRVGVRIRVRVIRGSNAAAGAQGTCAFAYRCLGLG